MRTLLWMLGWYLPGPAWLKRRLMLCLKTGSDGLTGRERAKYARRWAGGPGRKDP